MNIRTADTQPDVDPSFSDFTFIDQMALQGETSQLRPHRGDPKINAKDYFAKKKLDYGDED